MQQAQYEKLKADIFKFLWQEVEPLVGEIETSGRIPYEKLFPKFREHGLWGLLTPEEYGGAGLTVTQYLPILAEESKVSGGVRVLLHVHNSAAHGMCTARDEQKREYLPKIATGELSVAFGLTEATAGTGRDIKTTAVKKGDNYILNGEKHLITNADFAKLFMVICYTNRELGSKGVSSLLVDRDTPGFTIEPHRHVLGCVGSSHGILTFNDCVVPGNMVLGNEGDGLGLALSMLETSRVFIAASSLGTAERALELSLDYAKKRVTFGKPIAEREGVRQYLADMAIDVYALRTMLADAARKIDEGKRIPVEASACKTFGAEAVCRVTETALQVFGGIGYTAAYPIEMLHRDARLNLLEEGTLTIQRMVIARTLLEGYSWA
ncbi:MAG: acyl-CoA dehydrogenase family protein [Dehalococcoidia bacterium]|nr:acyl-CoA dehydrogenase family protein [Dehalococcoidia bacterium]